MDQPLIIGVSKYLCEKKNIFACTPLLTQTTIKGAFQASFIQYIRCNQSQSGYQCPTLSKWTEIWSQGCSTEISRSLKSKSDISGVLRLLQFTIYVKRKGIITKVTSACPLRKDVTLLPSPFCCYEV